MKILDPAKTHSVNVKHSSPGRGHALTLVSTPNCGKRAGVGKHVMSGIGNPPTLQFVLNDEGIIFGKSLPGENTNLPVKVGDSKFVVYSSGLIDLVTQQFNLNFEGKTSVSFSDFELLEFEGQIVAFVDLRNPN